MRIGIIKLSSLGDVIHALPVAHALREALPTAHLTWVVEAREQAILEGNPDLDALIPVDTRRWRRRLGSPSGLVHVLNRAREIRQSLIAARFDVVLDLQGLLKSGLITGFSGAKLRIGFSAGYCRERLNVCFTNHHVTPPASAKHVVEQYLSLLAPLRVEPRRVVFSIPTNVVLERRMDDFLSSYGVGPRDLVIALNPGSGRHEKRWPLASYRELTQRLDRETGARLLLLWGPGEDQLAKAIREGAEIQPVLPPHTTLPEMATLLRRCHLVIGSDTGPIHLSAALGVRTIGLFGPTSAVRNGPYGEHARSIQSPTGSMDGITVDSVLDTALDCLSAENVKSEA